MVTIEVIETPVSMSGTSDVPGVGAVAQIRIRTGALIEWPSVDLTFDKPILKAVLHTPDDGGCYSNCLFAQGGKLVRFSFQDPPFDSFHPIDVTVYSVEAVHVYRADVRSIHRERSNAGCRDGTISWRSIRSDQGGLEEQSR